VDKQTLLRKLEKMLDEAVCDRTGGTIEIDLKDGLTEFAPQDFKPKNFKKAPEENTRAPRNLR